MRPSVAEWNKDIHGDIWALADCLCIKCDYRWIETAKWEKGPNQYTECPRCKNERAYMHLGKGNEKGI